MTTPNRSISGLAPRPKPDASRLIAANRPVPAPDAASAATGEQAEIVVGVPAAAIGGSPAESADDNPSTLMKVSVYLPKGLRRAAVAAYKATAHLEGDQSWSDMIEKAVRAEVLRRQDAHNGGKPYPGGEGKLTPGRSVTS